MTTNRDNWETAAGTIAGGCLAVRVRMLSRVVSGIYDEALRDLGMTVGQLNILVVVARDGPLRPGDVARTLHMDKSTASRNIERMRASGWLAVSEGDTARTREVRVSRAGRRLLARALPRWREAQSRASSLLGERESRALAHTGDRVWSRLAGNG